MRHIGQVILLTVISCSIGCSSPTTKSGVPLGKAEYFKQAQQPTVTPNGRIKTESVKEVDGGKVQFETEDGKKWKVGMEPDGKGGYRYDTPEAVK